MEEIMAGVITSVVLIFIYRVFAKYFTNELLAATTLVAIAFIYVGYALKENPVPLIALEITATLFFYALAITGYKRNHSLIALGILLHGVWDILHHRAQLIGTDIPGYWPVFCITIDLITGFYFLFIFKVQKNRSWV